MWTKEGNFVFFSDEYFYIYMDFSENAETDNAFAVSAIFLS